MLLLLTRRVPTSYPVLALIATNLVISMPAPPFKRSPEDPPSGFSSVPKILEIQLPLKIATKDDLVAWAKYVMGLMASRINITNPSFKHFDGVKTSNGVQQFANSKTPENVRYAENVRNLGQTVNYDQGKIPANVRPLQSGIKEPIFKGTFDTTNSLKPGEQQLFVPQFPDFGPAIEVKINDIFRNTNAVSPPTRTYLPVTTTTDSIKFPTDPFATRYFFDGVERNVSNNLGVFSSDVTFTTHSPLAFNDEIPLPVKSIDLSPQQRNLTLTTPIQPLYKLPFEAVITFTREEPFETTTLNNDRGQLFTVVPTRGPLEQFPPYFDRNYTLTKESGQVNVVFDDGTQVTQSLNNTREERKKQGKQKDSSKRQQSKKQKSSKGQTSPIGQLLKTFVALRRNNTKPAEDLSPPPLNQEAPLFTTQGVPTRQRLPQRTQLYPTDRPPSIRQGKRNRTSLAQELEPDSDADISDVLQAALPIIQELSEADGEGFDIPAILVPILLQFSEGRDGMRDSAAILTPVLQLIAPLIGPLVGPLVVPLSRQSSQPPGQGGSSVGDLVKGLLGPLLENSGKGGKSDIMSLVKAIVAGSVAGTSAGSSGTTKDSYGAPTSYGAEYSPSTTYGRPNTPPTNPNPLLMLGSSIKDILNAVVKVVSSLVNAITSILGASSNSSNEPQRPSYGPPPPPYANRKPYRMPPDEPISITTREPPRLTRF
ncbi:hypothetical protein WH47_00057 [Habropoda laboriosa]|uniref:Uncharacterized protein n=1 Tax=Habropoda laboriosa TaxID=597456 RepID=A0A0L7RK95_9HYME|nr:hypothetical protein WH47_00057 [Habropoda laboriosa]